MQVPPEPDVVRPPAESLGGVRRRRSELKAAMVAFEEAVSTAWDDPGVWVGDVAERLDQLNLAFRHHVTIHEGAESFHAEVLRLQPHLSSKVASLQRDHRRLEQALGALADAAREPMSQPLAEDVQRRSRDLLHNLTRHRRRGADLVWEAFNTDLGGEN